MNNIRYASIRKLDISNGEGIGVALFVQGCPFHCYNCFNPETWDFNGGKEWTEEIEKEFLSLIDRPYIKRISILGGEPLTEQNLDEILELTNKISVLFPEKTIWLYTGYTWEQINTKNLSSYKDSNNIIRRKIVALCDVLVDGRYIDSQRDITLKWRGSKNQKVIDVQKSLQNGEIVLWTE